MNRAASARATSSDHPATRAPPPDGTIANCGSPLLYARVEIRALPEPFKENDIVLRVWGAVSEDDVRRWCEIRLSAYKQPSVIEIL